LFNTLLVGAEGFEPPTFAL